jgi:hypothetical protein
MRDPVFRCLHGIALNGKHNYHTVDGYELNPSKLDMNDATYEAGNVWEYNLRWLGSGLRDEALLRAKRRLTLFQIVLVVDGWFNADTQMLCQVSAINRLNRLVGPGECGVLGVAIVAR